MTAKPFLTNGLRELDAVARDGNDRRSGVARRFPFSGETKSRVLDLSRQQCSLGNMGVACARPRVDRSSAVSCCFEHSRRAEK